MGASQFSVSRAMEAYLKELNGLKRYDDAERLREEARQLTASLSELKSENDRLKKELLLNKNVKQEACQLREALDQAQHELSMLREVEVITKGEHATLGEAAREFVMSKEAEIRDRVEKESRVLQEKFETDVPDLVYRKLLAILKEPQWPAEIAQIMEKKAEEKAQSKLDEVFQQRVDEGVLGRLEGVKRNEWQPFVEKEASRIASDPRYLVAGLQGPWHITCDRCHRMVSAEIGPRQVAVLLRGERVVACPECKDFNLPPAPLFAPHKINGSALEDLLEAYLAGKGPPGKAAA